MEDLSRCAECAVCFQPLRNPKYLPCAHTFCFHCIVRLCEQPRRTLCPICRRSLEHLCLSSLPTNSYAESLVRACEMLNADGETLATQQQKAADDRRSDEQLVESFKAYFAYYSGGA